MSFQRLKRLFLLVMVPAVAAVVGVAFYLSGGRYVETDNAYIKADIIPLSSEISGVVKKVMVADNQTVHAGDPILVLDTEPLEVELSRMHAKLGEVAAKLDALKAEYTEQEAAIAMAKTNHDFAIRSLSRQKDLKGKNFVSELTLDDLQHNVDVTEQKVVSSKLQLKRIAAQLGGDASTDIKHHPSYRMALAEVEHIQLDIKRAKIHAPETGTVSQVPSVGQYIRAGNLSLTLVADTMPWVEANFTEKDLTHVREGQKASFVLDIYPDLEWVGTVQSMSPATGSEFSIIPVQNATGNFVKVPQRIPVKITFDPNQHAVALRSGFSVIAKIDTEYQRQLFSR